MATEKCFSWDLLNKVVDRSLNDKDLDVLELNPPMLLSLTDAVENIIRRGDISGAHVGVAGSVQVTQGVNRVFGAVLPTALAFDARFAQLLSAYNPASALYADDNPKLDKRYCPPDGEGFVVSPPPMIFGGAMKLWIENVRQLATAIIDEMVATLDPQSDSAVTSDDVRYSAGTLVLHLAHAINTTYGDATAGEIMKQMLFENIFTISKTTGLVGGRQISAVIDSIKRVISASSLRKDVFLLNLYQYCVARVDPSFTGHFTLHRDLAPGLGITDSDLIQDWDQYTTLLETVKTRTAALTPTSEWPDLTPSEVFAREGYPTDDEDAKKVDMTMLYFTKTVTGIRSSGSISKSVNLEHEREIAQTIVPVVPTQLPEIHETQFFKDLDPRDVRFAIPWLKRADEDLPAAVARMTQLTDFVDALDADIAFSRKQGITILIDKTDPSHPAVSEFTVDPNKVPGDDVYKEYWATMRGLVHTAVANQPFYADAYTQSHPGIRKKVLQTDVVIPTPNNIFKITVPRGTHVYLKFDEGSGPSGSVFVPKFEDVYSESGFAGVGMDFSESVDATVTPMILGHIICVQVGAHSAIMRPNQYQPRLGQFVSAYRTQLSTDNTVTSTDPAGTQGTKSDGKGVDSGYDLWLIIALIIYIISAINDSERGEMLALVILIARFMGVLDKWSFKLP